MAIGQGCTRKGALATCLSFPTTRSSTRTLGRKRVGVPPAPAGTGPHSPVRTLRKQRSTRQHMDDTVSLLESLPEDVLVMNCSTSDLLYLDIACAVSVQF
jgi:hypothetical protein